MSDVYQDSLTLHRQHQGKLGMQSLVPLKTKQDLSLAYTPGVAEVSRRIAQDPAATFDYTMSGRTVAVISDGSAVLGLGNIGPYGAMPVMEGKSLLLKQFGDVDSVPLVINTQDPDEIIKFVQQVAPSFIGINLEDIAAPNCFYIEEKLRQSLPIAVFHDDQHGTAMVVYAALVNAAKVVGKQFNELKVVIVGAGAAGMATAQLLLGLECDGEKCATLNQSERVGDVILVDRQGAIYSGRTDLNTYKKVMAEHSNRSQRHGSLADVMKGVDVVIGVSGPKLISSEMVKSMAPQAIVLAMANPTPEIMPDEAKAAGAMVVATGRSDFPNQVNNVLAFPGVFRAVVKARLTKITAQMKVVGAQALANVIANPTADEILPDVFYPNLAEVIAQAIQTAAES